LQQALASCFAAPTSRGKIKNSMGDPLVRIPRLYHFTCKTNLTSIKKLGGLYSTAKLKEMDVEFYPGGNQWSLDADVMSGMDQYVHLTFTMGHPMEKAAKDDGRIQSPLYLRIDRHILYEEVQFSAGVSNKAGIQICTIEEARDQMLIDYDVSYTYLPWSDPEVQARRQAAEKCEILVPDFVAMKFITNFPND
jgi:hypothetical protein